jgi:NAD(P)-dependent dehydrogenase (short-subunit alcohol dehydrogenase family)
MATRTPLTGSVAFVTGGASGIGRALSEALVDRGAEVVIADRQIEQGEAVAAAIRARGGRAIAIALDVRDGPAFDAAVRAVIERSGGVDYLFNNAGIGVGGDVEQYAQRDWDDVLDVNLRGVTHGIQAVYPHMIARGRGHIVNTASLAGLVPMPGAASYNASKHAVVGLGKALRVEAARHGVRVSTLCPGAIRTPILAGGRYGRNEHLGVDAATMQRWWERARPMDPRAFAEQVLDAVAKNEAYVIVPRWWRAVWWLERLSPTLVLRLAMRLHADRIAVMGSKEPAASASERIAREPAIAAR